MSKDGRMEDGMRIVNIPLGKNYRNPTTIEITHIHGSAFESLNMWPGLQQYRIFLNI